EVLPQERDDDLNRLPVGRARVRVRIVDEHGRAMMEGCRVRGELPRLHQVRQPLFEVHGPKGRTRHDGAQCAYAPGIRALTPNSYSTSTMHSISTGMPIGSEPMPTAERACLPRSPNT